MPGSARRKNAPDGPPLSSESFKRELNYQITASLVRTIYKRKLIRRNEKHRFLGLLVQKLRPLFGRLAYEVEKEKDK